MISIKLNKIINQQCLVQVRYISSNFSSESILTKINQKRCIRAFQRTPIIQMQTSPPKKYAAVLIPICYNSDGKIALLFTRRSATLRRHVRQVSYPGGMKDKTDYTYEDCALRETEEEIGLDRKRIEIWGTGNLIRPPHTAAIMPVVGLIKDLNLNELTLNKDEVDEIIIVDLEELCSQECKKHTQFKAGYSVPAYLVHNGRCKIWGITGAITNLFLSCLLPETLYCPKVLYVKPFKDS